MLEIFTLWYHQLLRCQETLKDKEVSQLE